MTDPLEASARTCMLAERAGTTRLCAADCPLWGLPTGHDGCALERILPSDDWPLGLARRWLRLRDALATQREPSSSNLHDFFVASSRAPANLGPWQANGTH
jgi:hypothetical protein